MKKSDKALNKIRKLVIKKANVEKKLEQATNDFKFYLQMEEHDDIWQN